MGETGVLRAKDAFSVERPIEIELRRGRSFVEKEMASNANAYARQVDTFSAAIEGNSEFPVLGEEGWQNQEVLDAAYRSLRSGKAESVPLIEKEPLRNGVEEPLRSEISAPQKCSKPRTA